MRLSVNLVCAGKYFRAFQDDIPDDKVPDRLRKFAVPETAAEESPVTRPADSPPEAPGTHVKRGSSWRRIGPDTEINPGEPTYRRIGKAFVPA